MKLKHILIYFPLAAALVGCDNIEENERIVGPIEFEAQKNILIEDFTGQTCKNCPLAAEAIHYLQEMYGESHIIAVAIHGGFMAIPAPAGLATTLGEEYVSHWGVEAFPNGLVDRTGNLQDYPTWSAKAIERLQIPSQLDLTVENTYEEASKTVNIQVATSSNTDISAKLQIWLVENNIERMQLMPDGSRNPNYIHNHVFRATVNGAWGEDIQLADGDESAISHEYKLEESWKPENMAVVAFVYNDKDGVLQVVSNDIINKE